MINQKIISDISLKYMKYHYIHLQVASDQLTDQAETWKKLNYFFIKLSSIKMLTRSKRKGTLHYFISGNLHNTKYKNELIINCN